VNIVASQHSCVYAQWILPGLIKRRLQFAEALMRDSHRLPGLALHVFELDEGWNWGLTIERPQGHGKKVIAFSEVSFRSEVEARQAGKVAYDEATASCEDTDGSCDETTRYERHPAPTPGHH
jgi:hypothetical protein